MQKYVNTWDPETNQTHHIPACELAPGMIPIRLGDDDPLVWIDAGKLKSKLGAGKVIHPPFNDDKRKILKQISEALREVWPKTVRQWDVWFRRGRDPERDIRVCQRIIFHYQRLTASGAPSQARKMDCFRLCVTSDAVKYKELILETTQLDEVTREEAANIIDTLSVFPADFFKGDFAKRIPGGRALDYSMITSLEEFKEKAAPATSIFAVDWATGNLAPVYGIEALKNRSGTEYDGTMGAVVFAIDFETDEVEHLLIAVAKTKGWAEWNGRAIFPIPDNPDGGAQSTHPGDDWQIVGALIERSSQNSHGHVSIFASAGAFNSRTRKLWRVQTDDHLSVDAALGEAYLAGIEKEALDELRGKLTAIGCSRQAIDAAFETITITRL